MDALKGRIQRQARTVPPSQHEKLPTLDAPPETGEAIEAVPPTPVRPKPKRPAKPVAKPTPRPTGGVLPMAEEPTTPMTVRVRMSIDDMVERNAYGLREYGLRNVTKAELVEMALMDGLPDQPSEDLAVRVREFRAKAPRSG